MSIRLHRLSATAVLLYLLSVTVAYLPQRAAEAAPGTASELISAFHDSLLAVMKEAKALGIKGRYDRLASRIEQSFNLPLMIQVAAGSHWLKASPDQINKLIGAFTHLSISTYASRFDGFAGESFETRGEKPGPQNTTLVNARIVKASGAPVEIVYVTRQTKGEWRILDVVVDNGISELAVRRSEYRSILQSGGVDGLIATLSAKADQLLKEKP